jgi:hypothetical protein
VVVVASVVAALLLGQNRVGSGRPDASQPTARQSPQAQVPPLDTSGQVTVLLTLRDDEREAVSNALIGVDPRTREVVELMLPRDLLLPSVPPKRLRDMEDPTRPQTAQVPLEVLLGVQIDALIDLDRLAWGGLIDATGSRVDAEVAERPGSFGLVLDRVLSGVPYEPETVGELLTGLGSMARTSVTNQDASEVLSMIGRGVRKRDVTRVALPVTYVRAGSERTAIADQDATRALMDEYFADSLLEPGHGGPLRVMIEPAGATLGATTWARMTLSGEGFGVLVDEAADAPSATSRVLVADGSVAARRAGEDVAAALGLASNSIAVAEPEQSVVDVRVVLGSDAPLPSGS